MKKIGHVLAWGVCLPSIAWSATVTTPTRVTSVLAYPQQAYIQREASVTLSKGDHDLVLTALPSFLEEQSVQLFIEGEEKPLLMNIDVQTKQDEQDPIYLQAKQAYEMAKKQLAEQEDKEFLLLQESAYLQAIRKNIHVPLSSAKLDDIQQVERYLIQAETDLMQRKRALSQKKFEYTQALKEAEKALDEAVERQEQLPKQVSASIRVSKAGTYKVKLHYMSGGVYWKPSYQLDYDSKKQQIDLRYYARLTQETVEDWDNIALSFATGNPMNSRAVPKPQPLWLGFENDKYVALRSADQMFEASEVKTFEAAATSKKAYNKMLVSEVQPHAISSVFTLPEKINVSHQTQDKSVLLAQHQQAVKVEYAYYAFDQDSVFTTIKGKNEMPYPLMAGSLQTFYDGRFIGNGWWTSLYPEQEFEQLIGQDQTIVVKKAPLKRLAQTQGIIQKTEKIRFEQETVLHNGRSEEVSVKVYDRLPISQEKEIIVTVEVPKAVQTDKQGIYQYDLVIPAKKSQTTKQVYTVEYPSDKKIFGL